jgi:peroxiredoxin
MKIRVRLSALAVLAVLSLAGRVTGEELQGAVKVSGREIQLQIRHADGRPAAGIPVRLLFVRRRTVAVGRTDADGRWASTVARTGVYEVVAEGAPGSTQSLRFSALVLDEPEAAPIPWGTAAAGAACLLGALLLGFVRMRYRVSARVVLLAAGVGLLGWSGWRCWLGPDGPDGPADPDVRTAARAYLRDRHVKPLSEPLEKLLADSGEKREPTQPYPLLGKSAPDFELGEARGKRVRLSDYLGRGPVVLVFYYGYFCNHCVGQLFALNDDIKKFRELGAEVITVSADPPELTRARFKQYGEFAFPVLSDPGYKVAQLYGTYRPLTEGKAEDLQHGTFVIARDGRVHWAHHGYEPFTGNRTLLYELARLEGRLPGGKAE